MTTPRVRIIEVSSLGPTGPAGPQGPSGSVDTGSLVSTSSFNSYTGSASSQFAGTASFAAQALTASYVDPLNQNVIINGDLNITGSFTASGLIYPTTDGAAGDVLSTDGLGNLTFERTRVYAQVKNISGVTLQKGMPVHVTSSVGNLDEVIAASASVASTMPATFILAQTLTDDEEGLGILTGFINGVDTSQFNEGDIVYVAANGGYTNIKPTGSNLIQNLGIVTKVDASNGSGFVYGSGRSNDVPNIQPGYVWIGNSDWVATPRPTSSIQNVISSSYAVTASYALNVGGSGLNFADLPTTEPSTTGSLWISGSSAAHPNSGYLMVFNP